MKLIHCADLHLDSSLKRHLDKEKIANRKAELIVAFEDMVAYAKREGVTAILIAGDLFDTARVTKSAGNVVLGCIRDAAEITFYYLKGNHDNHSYFSEDENGLLPDGFPTPQNLKLFHQDWTLYEEGEITIAGIELSDENVGNCANTLFLDRDKINVVMMHGQDGSTSVSGKSVVIPINDFRNHNIDYMALGHIHSFKEGRIDARGTFAYSGCLEGRGFDEIGEKGFILLNISEENKTIEKEFIPFAKRKVIERMVDVSDCNSTNEVAQRIEEEVKEIDGQNLVRIILTGEVEMDSERNLTYLETKFEKRFFVFKMKDKTTLRIEPKDYQYDVSLRGEFIRLVLEKNLDEETTKNAIELGLGALSGEEI